MPELNKTERIAERAEELTIEAQQAGVNVYILVQGGSQGGVYYYRNCDKRILSSLLKQSARDFRANELEQDGLGNISYGL